jgi:hypothetical protein
MDADGLPCLPEAKGYVIIRATIPGALGEGFLPMLKEQHPEVFVHDPNRPWVKGLLSTESLHLTLVSDIDFSRVMPSKSKDEDAYMHGKAALTEFMNKMAGELAATNIPLKIAGLGVFPSPDNDYVCLHAKVDPPPELRKARIAITSRLPSFICFEPWSPHISLAYMKPETAEDVCASFELLPESERVAYTGEWMFSGSLDELL